MIGSDIRIKNCGFKTASSIAAAIQSGADFLGFIHYPKSARYVTPKQASVLAASTVEHVHKVAVLVNPTDADIAHISALGYADYLQLHGDETPARIASIAAQSGLPIIKAVGIKTAEDLANLDAYEAQCEHLLLDAKSPDYGGTGEAFDWSLLREAKRQKPWFLSGGLTAENVQQALLQTGAPMIDVSSGIEREKGVKDEAMITAFNETVRRYDA